jgi:hypothetical protein
MGKTQFKSLAAWRGHGMACINQTRSLCVNQMETKQSKPVAARRGHGMVFVNPPLDSTFACFQFHESVTDAETDLSVPVLLSSIHPRTYRQKEDACHTSPSHPVTRRDYMHSSDSATRISVH